MNQTLDSTEVDFRAHLIWIAGKRSDPLLRVLLATTPKAYAVFDGIQPWSICSSWIDQLQQAQNITVVMKGVKRALVRNTYATFQLRSTPRVIESFGLCRADRLEGFENVEARRVKAE